MIFKRALRDRSVADLIQWSFQRSLGILTSRLRLLPDFIIIGAQRCGTTSLFNYLSQHPDVRPSFPKETHYFSNYYRKGVSWYRSHFPLSQQKQRAERDHGHSFLTGEATPYYFSHPLVPRRVYENLPNVLLIVLLRNPVDRAYSHYHHEVKMGIETLSFEEAIDKEQERLADEKEKLLQDENYRSFNYQNFSYLSRGIYIDQLELWRHYFDQEQLLILKSEGFYEHPASTLRMVMNFLGIPARELDEYKKYHYSPYPSMDPATRRRLMDYYELHNQKLYEYLGVNLCWDRV